MSEVKKASAAAQDNIQAAPSAVAPVGTPNRGDPRGVAGRSEPIVNRGPDLAAPDCRRAGPLVAGDEQQDAVLRSNGLLERPVDCAPRGVEAHAVEIEYPVWFNGARTQSFVPTPVQRPPVQFLRGTASRNIANPSEGGASRRRRGGIAGGFHRLRLFPFRF
jgi:hypothetical protein